MKPIPISPDPTPPLQPTSCDILAFGAHPDDIEFGCGGVIARETLAGRSAHFVVCSRGEAATHGTPDQRVAESAAGAKLLKASLEFVDLGGDAHVEKSNVNALKLAAAIRRRTPRLLIAPTPCPNQHPDHSALGELVRDAARLARYGGLEELRPLSPHAIDALLFYAITPDAEVPPGPSAGSILIDISAPKVIDAWTAAMECHASQHATRDYVEMQKIRARLHGLRAGIAYAIPLFPNDPILLDSLDLRGARHF